MTLLTVTKKLALRIAAIGTAVMLVLGLTFSGGFKCGKNHSKNSQGSRIDKVANSYLQMYRMKGELTGKDTNKKINEAKKTIAKQITKFSIDELDRAQKVLTPYMFDQIVAIGLHSGIDHTTLDTFFMPIDEVYDLYQQMYYGQNTSIEEGGDKNINEIENAIAEKITKFSIDELDRAQKVLTPYIFDPIVAIGLISNFDHTTLDTFFTPIDEVRILLHKMHYEQENTAVKDRDKNINKIKNAIAEKVTKFSIDDLAKAKKVLPDFMFDDIIEIGQESNFDHTTLDTFSNANN